MTKARSLRAFFKKFFNLDSSGMSVSAVLDEITQNNETFPVSGGGDSSGSSGLYAPIEWISQQDDQYRIPFSYNEIKAAVESGSVATISSSYEDPQQAGATVTKFYHAASFTIGEMGGATVYAVQFATVYGSEDLMFVALDPDNALSSFSLLQPQQDDTI